MKLSLSKDRIDIENSTIVWNAYEFLNRQDIQKQILDCLPNTPLKLDTSELPAHITTAIMTYFNTKTHTTTRKSKLHISPTMISIILIFLNLTLIATKYATHSQNAKHTALYQQQLILEKRKSRKTEQEAKQMNTNTAQLLSKIMSAKIPLITLSITPRKTTITIPKTSTQHWINYLTKHHPQYLPTAEIETQSKHDNTITLHYEYN